MSISGPYICPCCGESEAPIGCLCEENERCLACNHCVDHHHQNCTDEFRALVYTALGEQARKVMDLRKKHKVNIFEKAVSTNSKK